MLYSWPPPPWTLCPRERLSMPWLLPCWSAFSSQQEWLPSPDWNPTSLLQAPLPSAESQQEFPEESACLGCPPGMLSSMVPPATVSWGFLYSSASLSLLLSTPIFPLEQGPLLGYHLGRAPMVLSCALSFSVKILVIKRSLYVSVSNQGGAILCWASSSKERQSHTVSW